MYKRFPQSTDGIQIYNPNETRMQTVEPRTQRIVTAKWVKQCKVTTAEKTTLLTVCCINSASLIIIHW